MGLVRKYLHSIFQLLGLFWRLLLLRLLPLLLVDDADVFEGFLRLEMIILPQFVGKSASWLVVNAFLEESCHFRWRQTRQLHEALHLSLLLPESERRLHGLGACGKLPLWFAFEGLLVLRILSLRFEMSR